MSEHCDGTVRPKRVKREVFKHKARFVILEDVTIGESCGPPPTSWLWLCCSRC